MSKVWFITGCSAGLGAALAEEVLRRGDRVIATARSVDKLDALKAAGAAVMTFDVTSPLSEIQQKAEEALLIFGQIDYLINNAGYLQVGTVEESTVDETQAQFDTNVFGLLNTTRAFLPIFRKQHAGVIGNISSIGGWGGWASASLYCGSKWAVSGISESMRYELADFGIKVCCIEPGYFRSTFLNPNNRREPNRRRVEAYTGTTADTTEKFLQSYNNNQPGDPKKAAQRMFDVLSQSDGKEIPMRLALGSDAYDFIKKKCEDTLVTLEEWKTVTQSTDIDQIST